jgi:hypothetical protein
VRDNEFISAPDRTVVTVLPDVEAFESPVGKLVFGPAVQGSSDDAQSPEFNAGRVIPLKMTIACGGQALTRAQDSPSIVSMLRDGAPLPVTGLNDGDLRFRLAGKK